MKMIHNFLNYSYEKIACFLFNLNFTTISPPKPFSQWLWVRVYKLLVFNLKVSFRPWNSSNQEVTFLFFTLSFRNTLKSMKQVDLFKRFIVSVCDIQLFSKVPPTLKIVLRFVTTQTHILILWAINIQNYFVVIFKLKYNNSDFNLIS